VVELFVRRGAPGVLVCGCPPRDCVGREGPKWLRERLFNDREAELQPRVDRRRVGIITLAPGNLAESLAAFESFVRNVSALQPPEPAPDDEFEVPCEPVPLAESKS
jgi:coenzyme F420-reducing hydrogenase delta subunit